MALGDHAWVWRRGYQHHAIDLGDGWFVQYSGLADGLRAGPVRVVCRQRFSHGVPVRVRWYPDKPFTHPEVAERAISRVGEDRYSVLFNNCEHFASWAATGRAASKQLQTGALVLSAAGLILSAGVIHRALHQRSDERRDSHERRKQTVPRPAPSRLS